MLVAVLNPDSFWPVLSVFFSAMLQYTLLLLPAYNGTAGLDLPGVLVAGCVICWIATWGFIATLVIGQPGAYPAFDKSALLRIGLLMFSLLLTIIGCGLAGGGATYNSWTSSNSVFTVCLLMIASVTKDAFRLHVIVIALAVFFVGQLFLRTLFSLFFFAVFVMVIRCFSLVGGLELKLSLTLILCSCPGTYC